MIAFYSVLQYLLIQSNEFPFKVSRYVNSYSLVSYFLKFVNKLKSKFYINNTPIVVKKVVLVYDIEEIIELEKELDKLVERKKDIIKENDYNFSHPKVLEIDQQINKLEHSIHQTVKNYERDNKKFAGIAFISFDDENMKNLVLQENQHTQLERMRSYWNKGKLDSITDHDLSWHNQKLFIEQAPEPNEVDWEFIHVKTEEKISKRLKAWIIYILVESLAFYSIYLIAHRVAKYGDEAREEEIKGKLDHETMMKINILSFVISLSIVQHYQKSFVAIQKS